MREVPNQALLVAANERRHRNATAYNVAATRKALRVLGKSAPPRLAEAGRLRLAHPDATLTELGALANPPLGKDVIAGRLRRLLECAAGRLA